MESVQSSTELKIIESIAWKVLAEAHANYARSKQGDGNLSSAQDGQVPVFVPSVMQGVT